MKPRKFLTFAAALIAAGCGTVVTSTRETALPLAVTPYPGLAYYLPQGRVLVAGSWNKDARNWDLKITPLFEADSSARFVLNRKSNPWYDDDVTLAVDPTTGLLQTINAITTDQTANILGAVASAVGAALTFGASLGP
jgi:hypothetical protein